jgi:hypothetical protein
VKWNPGNRRVWLYRGIVALAIILMIVSFAMPWWSVHISEVPFKDAVTIYGYGFRHNLVELRTYVVEDETPLYQTILAWVYVALSAALILFSTWLKGIKGQLLLGCIGIFYIAYAVVAIFVVTAGRIADFNISLSGSSSMIYHYVIDVVVGYNAGLRLGYYLAYAAGGMCLLLALIRNFITGSIKSSLQENTNRK